MGEYLESNSFWWYWISISKDYTTLPYLTIRHDQTYGVRAVYKVRNSQLLGSSSIEDGLTLSSFTRCKFSILPANFIKDDCCIYLFAQVSSWTPDHSIGSYIPRPLGHSVLLGTYPPCYVTEHVKIITSYYDTISFWNLYDKTEWNSHTYK